MTDDHVEVVLKVPRTWETPDFTALVKVFLLSRISLIKLTCYVLTNTLNVP
jgi:hypothetical protein